MESVKIKTEKKVKPSRNDSYKIPVDFNHPNVKTSYNITTGNTTIIYRDEMRIFKGKIFNEKTKPTQYNVWNLWRYGEIYY